MTQNNWIIEVDITHRCNMRCRHCNRLCNAEERYGVLRRQKDMSESHIDFLCNQIRKQEKGKVRLLRIIGGEPLLSPILNYAIKKFEQLISDGYAKSINIVTNGTIMPTDICKPYLVYSPVRIGQMLGKNHTLSTKYVYDIKNAKHRNITISPLDISMHYEICNRCDICGIQFSIYGFAYTAACFPSLFVNQSNHKRFLHHLPHHLDEFFDETYEADVCSICVSAITAYTELIAKHPEIQSENFIGNKWGELISTNRENFNEPDTKWNK